MQHSFEIEDASKYGINSAIILYHLKFWVAKNEANDKHFHEGKYWTYCSVIGFEKLFPYMTSRNIRSAIENLEKLGVISSGNFNTSSYDRTKWFCINRQIHLPILTNGNVNSDNSVTDVVNRYKEDSVEILNHLNKSANKNFKPIETNLKIIISRLKEGATKDECISVINGKVADWLSDPKMNEYLRPATLFNATKFSQYVGSISSEDAFNPFHISNFPNYRGDKNVRT